MEKFWGMVKDFYWFLGHGLKQATQRPHSDRWARASLAMWIFVTLCAVVGLASNVVDGSAFWWSLPLNLAAFIFEVVMVTWAIQGILFRRRMRQMEAVLKELYEALDERIRREQDG